MQLYQRMYRSASDAVMSAGIEVSTNIGTEEDGK